MIEDIQYPVGSGLQSTTHESPFVSNPPPVQCGPLKFMIEYDSTPVTQSTQPMAYENKRPREIDVETDDTNLIGTKVPYKITVFFENWSPADYPEAPQLTELKDVIYVSACPNLLQLDATRQDEGQTINYDNVGNKLTIKPHVVNPDYCKIDYECKSVTGPLPSFGDSNVNSIDCDTIIPDLTCEEDDLSDCDITIPIDPECYESGSCPPGVYCVTISGCNPASLTEQCEDTEICVTLVDPCDPPELIQASNIEDQTYTLGVTNQGYDAPEFTVDPEFCLVTYTTTMTKFTDTFGNINQSGVTDVSSNSDLDFNFFWNRDESPLTNTQTITVTATSGSIYQTKAEPTIVTDEFDVIALTPCGRESVVIQATTQNNDLGTDEYSGNPMTFTYRDFTVTPDYCETTIKCSSVSPASPLPCKELDDNGQASWTFTPTDWINKTVPPGTYTFTYEVCDKLNPNNCEPFDVTFVVVDPCVDPGIVTPSPSAMVYTISDAKTSQTLSPPFSVSPDFCDAGTTLDPPEDCGQLCDIVQCEQDCDIITVGPTDNIGPS